MQVPLRKVMEKSLVPQRRKTSRSFGHSSTDRGKEPRAFEGHCWQRSRGCATKGEEGTAEKDCSTQQAETWEIIWAYFTVLPGAGLGAFISTTQADICGEMS